MKLRQSPNTRGVTAFYKAFLVQDGVFLKINRIYYKAFSFQDGVFLKMSRKETKTVSKYSWC